LSLATVTTIVFVGSFCCSDSVAPGIPDVSVLLALWIATPLTVTDALVACVALSAAGVAGDAVGVGIREPDAAAAGERVGDRERVARARVLFRQHQAERARRGFDDRCVHADPGRAVDLIGEAFQRDRPRDRDGDAGR